MPRRAMGGPGVPGWTPPRKTMRPVLGGQKAGHQVEQGGLAGAVGADDRLDDALGHRKAHLLHGLARPPKARLTSCSARSRSGDREGPSCLFVAPEFPEVQDAPDQAPGQEDHHHHEDGPEDDHFEIVKHRE